MRPRLPVISVLGRGLVPAEAPVLRADDLGVLRGDGVFETVRVAGGRPVLLDEHLARMQRGAAVLDIDLPAAKEWRALVTNVLAAAEALEAVLKLVCTRGPEDGAPTAYAIVSAQPPEVVTAREAGISAITLSLGVTGGRGHTPWLLGGVKTTSYAVAMAAQREARTRGADDVIWVTADGDVLEGATSNVVWVSRGRLVTPPTESGILAGVTLGALAKRFEIEVRRTTLDDLVAADEVALTSSVRGVAPVRTLDGRPVGVGGIGTTTAALRRCYEELCAAR